MEIRPFSSRPNLCTVIDLANARAARSVGLSAEAHVFQINDLVACADGAQGRIREFKGRRAVLALAGLFGIRRVADLSTLRKLPEPGGAA